MLRAFPEAALSVVATTRFGLVASPGLLLNK